MVEEEPGSRAHLEAELRKTQKAAFCEGTVANLLSQWRAFYAFCSIYALRVWPVLAHILCLFAQFLSFNLKSPASVVNYLSGLRTLHLLTNKTPPDFKDFEVTITLRGLKRRMKHAVNQARPITPLVLAQIYCFLNLRKKLDAVVWAALLLGFFMMLRASNLVPKAVKKFSAKKQLTRNSLAFNKKGFVAKIKWSKTIQFRERILEIPVFAIPRSILCPVRAIKRVMAFSTAGKYGPLLGISDKNPLTYGMLQKKTEIFVR